MNLPDDFETALTADLTQRLGDLPEGFAEHLHQAVLHVLHYRHEPRIPEELLHFKAAQWIGRHHPGVVTSNLHALEAYNAACANWCRALRIWTGDFEAMRQRQIALRREENTTHG